MYWGNSLAQSRQKWRLILGQGAPQGPRKGATMYELVIIWENGDKDVYEYESREKAEEIGRGYKELAFGDQVTWYGVRKKQ